jgi:DNA-binding Lrp family transcriptional regulator
MDTPRRETPRKRALRRTAEAAVLAIDWLGGKTIHELAESYNLSNSQVQNRLNQADQLGMTEKFRELLLCRLVPPALAVYEARILGGDLDAARDMLFGLGVLTKSGAQTTVRVIPGEGAITDIKQYRQYRKRLNSLGEEFSITNPEVQ